jgi:RND family efflux transporter MFP subunit
MIVRTRSLTALIPITALALSTACGHEEPQRVEADLKPVKVEVVDVERVSQAKPIDVRGIVQPTRQAAVSSRVMGPVVALKVRAGATVAEGQVLLEIQPEAADGQLAQARGALAQAQAALALSERNFQRFKALHAENAASELELDMARMQFEQARGAVAQAEGGVSAASSVAAESEVSAPFAARVIQTLVEVGDLAAPGRPLVRVESLEGQQIWLTVRESDIHRVAVGDQVGVRLDARPELGEIIGSVQEIVPWADADTHTFTVKVGLGSIHVPSGFSGRAVISGDSTDRLVVPAGAVHRRGGLELVVVRAADGTARTRAVTTGGMLGDGRIEVLSGVNQGESVVTNALGPLADGTPLELSR